MGGGSAGAVLFEEGRKKRTHIHTLYPETTKQTNPYLDGWVHGEGGDEHEGDDGAAQRARREEKRGDAQGGAVVVVWC